jgi:hypothetical protein
VLPLGRVPLLEQRSVSLYDRFLKRELRGVGDEVAGSLLQLFDYRGVEPVPERPWRAARGRTR